MLSDTEILERCFKQGMIYPFVNNQQKVGPRGPIIGWGMSSYGYDIRVGNQFKIFTDARLGLVTVDPKLLDPKLFVDEETQGFILIPPNSFALGISYERIRMPRDLLAICIGKSTYARCGIVMNVTPLEPEWEGYITIEISNTTPLPARIYAGEGIAQLIFFKGDRECAVSYSDRAGKYQDQTEVTLPRV